MDINAHQLFTLFAAIACGLVLLVVGFQFGRERAVEAFQARTDALTERTRLLADRLADAERECEVLREDMEHLEAEREQLRRQALTARDGHLLHEVAATLHLAARTFQGITASRRVGSAYALATRTAELAERIAPSQERAA